MWRPIHCDGSIRNEDTGRNRSARSPENSGERVFQAPAFLDDVKSQPALNLTRIVPAFLAWGQNEEAMASLRIPG